MMLGLAGVTGAEPGGLVDDVASGPLVSAKVPPIPLLPAKVSGVPATPPPVTVRKTGGVKPRTAEPSAPRNFAPPSAPIRWRLFASRLRSKKDVGEAKKRSATEAEMTGIAGGGTY